MQAMNTDQPPYYPAPSGPHPAPNGYYQTNGIDTHFTPRNPNGYGQHRMHQPYYAQGPNAYNPQQVYMQSFVPPSPFVHANDPQSMTPFRLVVRPPNEVPTGAPNYMQPTSYLSYPNNNLQQQSTAYPTPYYRPPYHVPQNIPQQTSAAQLSNQTQLSPSQYTLPNNQQQTQSSINQQYGTSSQSSQSQEKRKRQPLKIVDPVSQKALELEPEAPPVNPTPSNDEDRQKDTVVDSTNITSKVPDDTNKTQKREDFRRQMADLIKPNGSTEKTENQSSNVVKNETRKESTAIKTTQQSQPGYPGIRTRSITDEKPVLPPNLEDTKENKRDQINSQKQLENTNSETTSDNEVQSTEEIQSDTSDIIDKAQPASTLPATESLDDITATPSNDTESESVTSEKTPSKSQRYTYSIEELRAKRYALSAQKKPTDLKYVADIYIPPAKPKSVDANVKFLREIRLILNKLTPQTYEKLLKKLDELELDRYERLEGMIDIFFSKAVEEPKFCFMYAALCQHFQRKQVTVPGLDGQMVTHYFRQILLTRCQTKFETDYRQDIDYDKRKLELDAITDEKRQKEAAEDLEEALFKAKRRNFGNILFIGELFKLGMLTETIMFDCMDYLLQDKADEENLECLCKLLRAIGKELDARVNDKSQNRKNLENNYKELENIVGVKQVSARARFMIQDLMDLRKANWVARIAEAKPMKIDDIHEQERIKREQQERDQERDRQQRRDQHRNNPGGGGGGGNNNPQQYTGRGSRGSGMKQQPNRMDDDRNVSRFSVNSVRQYQTSDKRNPTTTLNLAPQFTWSKPATTEKKPEDDRANMNRTGKPPSGSTQQYNNKSKTATPPGTPGYMTQRQPSRELARDNPVEVLRRTASASKEVPNSNNTSMTDSRNSSRNVSREQSRNASRESSLNKVSATSASTTTTAAAANNSFDEEKTTTRVHALIEEYTENYSDNNNRSVLEAVEDLSDFCTSNTNQQAIIVRELFTNVLEGKPRARKAIGHLLDMTLQKNLISDQGFLSGLKMLIEAVPDYIVDIPLVWQYIGEILGAFIGGSSSNMLLLKPILLLIPDEVSKQLFQYITRYAIEFSSKSHVQTNWQSVNFSLNDLFEPNSIDSSFLNEYNWLSDATETTTTGSNKENNLPRANSQLVTLFKSVNDQESAVPDAEITKYIHEKMNSEDKFYIRTIVLSYLEACLINRGQQIKIQEDIAKKRMTVLNGIIEHKPEAELQVVYAIQNFVSKLEHPPKMAQLLFDIFYDEECVSEDTFYEWLNQPDQSEIEGHSIVVVSTKDFFDWLQQAETEGEGDEE
ncbi:unnamed protein product [Adineta steineri]|uniref:Uncharacterized protein n=1 Tax=Adineta steineri TaxID=433720 RepID=A0A818V5S9_9BILA|nr:unnamed protein product [Adineta steineri]